MPIGYANWMPVITAVLTLVILVLLVTGMKKDRKIPISICLIACIAATFVSWSVFSTLTIIGAVVFALHFALLTIQLLNFETKESDADATK
jgi:apolipoprotein N-acyltransferase